MSATTFTHPIPFPCSKVWSIDTEQVIGIRKLTTRNLKELWQVVFQAIDVKEPVEIATFPLREQARAFVQGMAYAAGEGLLRSVLVLSDAQGEPESLLRVRPTR